MAFYCDCGHTRGNHEHPLADTSKVGKCKVIVAPNIVCGCQHYTSKLKDGLLSKDAKDYHKLGIYQLIIASCLIIPLASWLLVLPSDLGQFMGAITTYGLGFGLWWYKFGESFFAKLKAEKSE